jgi:hypothetical protein
VEASSTIGERREIEERRERNRRGEHWVTFVRLRDYPGGSVA